MNYDTYGSNAVELAIHLANTDRDAAAWVPAFLDAHAEWFTEGTPLELSGDDVEQVGQTSDLVRAVAVADSQDEVVARLNELLALARPHPYATDHDGELHLHYARPDAPALSSKDVPGENQSPWDPRKARAQCGSSRPALASSMASSTAVDP